METLAKWCFLHRRVVAEFCRRSSIFESGLRKCLYDGAKLSVLHHETDCIRVWYGPFCMPELPLLHCIADVVVLWFYLMHCVTARYVTLSKLANLRPEYFFRKTEALSLSWERNRSMAHTLFLHKYAKAWRLHCMDTRPDCGRHDRCMA